MHKPYSNNAFIIAEAGVNHNGNLDIAFDLVDAAAKSGADAVKFQTFTAKSLVSKGAPKARYQLETTDKGETQFEMIEKLQLSYNDFSELKKYCGEVGIEFISTPFDLDSIDFLAGLGLETIKIPSGEITNLPYLTKAAKTGIDIILSTGMSTLAEVEAAMNVLKSNSAGEIILLHCTTEYPAPYADVNLKAMLTLKDKFGVRVGYSDHTPGIEIPIAAVAMGAQVIEKHFTLDKNMEGPDHKASLEPDELQAMVRAIRNVEAAMGSGEKAPSESEIKNMPIARKSIVALKNIRRGEIFSEDNLTVKRPGTGISPMRWNEVIGMPSNKDYKEDELIEL